MRSQALSAAPMIRIHAMWLAVQPIDMRSDAECSRAIASGVPKPHSRGGDHQSSMGQDAAPEMFALGALFIWQQAFAPFPRRESALVLRSIHPGLRLQGPAPAAWMRTFRPHALRAQGLWQDDWGMACASCRSICQELRAASLVDSLGLLSRIPSNAIHPQTESSTASVRSA